MHWNDFYQFVILHTLVPEQELITVYLIFFGLPTKHISIADCQCLLSNINSQYTFTGEDQLSENYHKLAITCPNGISSNDVAHMVTLCPKAFEPLIRFRENCTKYIFSNRRLESIKMRNVQLDTIMIYRSEHNNKFPTGNCCEYISNLIKYHCNPLSYDFGPDQNDDLINIRNLVYQIKFVSNILTNGSFMFGGNNKNIKSDSGNKRIDRLKYESEVFTRPLSLSSASNQQLNQQQLQNNINSRKSTRNKHYSNGLSNSLHNNNVRTSYSNNNNNNISLINNNNTATATPTTTGLQYSQINHTRQVNTATTTATNSTTNSNIINNGNGFAIGSTFSSTKRGNSKITVTPLHSGGTNGGSESTATGSSTLSNNGVNSAFSPTEINLPNSLDSFEDQNGKIGPYKAPLSPLPPNEKE